MSAPAYTVRVAGDERPVSLPADQPVLAGLLAAGVDYPHGCRAGRCGRCKSALLEGEVDMLPHSRFALTPAEREAGRILVCSARARSDLRIEWQGPIPEPTP